MHRHRWSLSGAQLNFRAYGACEQQGRQFERPPADDEPSRPAGVGGQGRGLGGARKALPLQLEGRYAAEPITFGDQWSGAVTVDLGRGRYVYVEKYAKGHSVSESELSQQARGTAKKVLRNLRAR